MARKTTAQLIAEIAALFPDNTTGLITPASLRTSLTNICDSFTDAYGAMQGLPGVVQALTATVAKLVVFDTVLRTSAEVTPSATNDNVTVSALADYAFEFTCTVAGANNEVVRLVMRVDGVETPWTFQTTLSVSNTAEMSFSGIIVAIPAGGVVDVGVSSTSGNQSPTFSQNVLIMHDIQQ